MPAVTGPHVNKHVKSNILRSVYNNKKQEAQLLQIIIIIISTTMFMVLSSWQSHCESSPGSFDDVVVQYVNKVGKKFYARKIVLPFVLNPW